MNPNKEQLNRRQFLVRSAKAAASVAAIGCIGYGFHDSHGPDRSSSLQEDILLPDFSVPGTGKKMSIVHGSDRAQTLQAALKAIGGIESIIQKRDRVLIKVNAAFASPPLLSATSHPQLVGEIARLCYNAGAASVKVTDNPINDPASCFSLTGISAAARSAGAKVILPAGQYFKPLTAPGAKLIQSWPVLYDPLVGVNKLIGTAPIKDHHRSGASMVMKNWYGLLGGRRNIFHQDIHNIIKELAMMVRPSLVILDGTTTMMSNGPTGGSLADLKDTHTMIVATDQVAADAYGATLLGKTVTDLSFIAKAEAMGVGTADYRSLNPVQVTI